ncbi:hypothetical protein D3C85_1795300 [compost metagenome]
MLEHIAFGNDHRCRNVSCAFFLVTDKILEKRNNNFARLVILAWKLLLTVAKTNQQPVAYRLDLHGVNHKQNAG